MKPELQYLLAFALALLPALAFLFLGLYLGERGRRQDAQRREVYGTPLKPQAREIPQPPDVEERVRNMGFDPATVARGIEALQAEAKKAGRQLGHEEARSMALEMLHPDGV